MDEEGQPNYPPSNVIDEGAREALLRVHSEGQENKHEYNTIRNTFSDTSPDDDDASFFKFFLRSNGPPQVAVVCLTLALALGSTVGVVSSL